MLHHNRQTYTHGGSPWWQHRSHTPPPEQAPLVIRPGGAHQPAASQDAFSLPETTCDPQIGSY